MPYITRDDGERFVVPSYRDVLSAKKEGLLKREILLLSSNYGEYITLQRKGTEQYEIAFSSDPGYLLGETVWHHFDRPWDLVYCEEIPNTAEAILVIVKAGMVYLDGTFPIDAIYDELVVFRTQQNSFHIYIYGDVPISQTFAEDKFYFDSSSVKSFTVLEESAFAELPLVKAFQLQLVNQALKEKGIGAVPIKPFLISFAVIALIWIVWGYFSLHKKELPATFVRVVNPYQLYLDNLTSPNPYQEVHWITTRLWLLLTMPGWVANSVEYSSGSMRVNITSVGGKTKPLYDWAARNQATVQMGATGFLLVFHAQFTNRPPPASISSLDRVIGNLIDNLFSVLPGNNLQVGTPIDRTRFVERQLVVSFTNISPTIFDLVGQQFKNGPFVLTKAALTLTNGNVNGSMTFQALGS